MLQQYLISIDARLRSRNSTVSVTLGDDSRVSDANTFHVHFE